MIWKGGREGRKSKRTKRLGIEDPWLPFLLSSLIIQPSGRALHLPMSEVKEEQELFSLNLSQGFQCSELLEGISTYISIHLSLSLSIMYPSIYLSPIISVSIYLPCICPSNYSLICPSILSVYPSVYRLQIPITSASASLVQPDAQTCSAAAGCSAPSQMA